LDSSKEAAVKKRHVVELKEPERERLARMIGSGRDAARRLAHARVLLKCGQGLSDAGVSEAVGASVGTVERVRKRYAAEGSESALSPRPQPPRPHKRRIDGDNGARLVAIAWSKAPAGRGHRTLHLLADRMVRMKYVEAVSYRTVGRALKKTRSSPG
jgi:transposase